MDPCLIQSTGGAVEEAPLRSLLHLRRWARNSSDRRGHSPSSMHRLWYRSRLLWIGFAGFIFIGWIGISPMLLGEGRYFAARWIAPGNFYQGLGITQEVHRIELWAGRPYAGLGNPLRQTGITSVSFPFEPTRHSWAVNERGPIWFEWGTPSADSFTVAVDHWFVAAVYLILWITAMILWQRRKRRFLLSPIMEPNAQQIGGAD